MQKAVIYCRVSTDEQAEHGTSLQTQEQACLKKAAELAAQVVCIRRDEGVSGSLYSTRPGVQDALADLETGIANILIAYDVSRLSRDVEHHALISKRVKAANSRIVYCTQDFADNVDGELQSGIMKQFAQWEKGKIRERTMSGRRRLAESGLMPIRSRSAYGYHIVTKADALRNTYPDAKAGEYVIVEEQARWIRKMFAWYAAGESAIAICLRLHEQGVPTANGGFEWRQPTVRYLLQNAAYKGEVISHKQETRRDESRAERGLKKITYSVTAPEERWVRIPIPAIVDERLWNICQERLEINKEFLKGNPNNKFMLTGLLRCPVCGHSMGGRRDGKEKQYLSYMCRQHAKSRNTSGIVCNSKRYPGRVWSNA